jgi:hypothetical protein
MSRIKEKKWYVNYTEDELDQYNQISQRMHMMRDLREMKLKILNNQSVSERYLQNQMDHVAYVGSVPERHEWKSRIRGTQSRTRLHKLVGLIMAENLGPTVKVFNRDFEVIEAMSDPWTNILRRTNAVEDLYRVGDNSDIIHELLIQGTVFVEEIYDTVEDENNVTTFDPSNLELMRKSRKKETKTVSRVYKKVLDNTSVFLGNFNIGSIQEQPDMAIRTVLTWDEAKSKYGKWERWKYVETMAGKGKEELSSTYENLNDAQYMLKALGGKYEDVEVVRYMRRNPQTYQIYLNGVQMLPPETGFPWGYNKYNVAHRVLYPVDINFPYGSSIYDLTRGDQGVLDMLVNLDVDSKRQLLEPSVSIANKSIRSINLFRPNTVHYGVNPEDIRVLSTQTPANNSVWQTIQHFNMELDKMYSPTVMGQPLSGEHSATEVSEMQKSALKILGYLYIAVEGLIRDTSWLRIHNIVSNCIGYEKNGKTAYSDGIRTELYPEFEEFLIENVLIGNGKKGKMRIRFIPKEMQEKVLRSEVSMREEDLNAAELLGFDKLEVMLLKKQRSAKSIYEEIIIDPDMMRTMEWYYNIYVEPMQKNTTAFERAEFRETMTDAVNLFGPESLNLESAKSEFAKIHKLGNDFFKGDEEPHTQNVADQTPNMPTVEGGDGNVVAKQQGKTPEMTNQLMASVKRRQG